MEVNQLLLLNTLLHSEVQKFNGLSTTEIKEKLNITSSAKNFNHVLFSKIIQNSINREKIHRLIDECNCVIKTVNLEWNNNLKESMSLNVFKYTEIVEEEWETSKLRSYFMDRVFVFVVFKKGFSGSTLEDIKVWKMPISILDSGVANVWKTTKALISEGKIVNYIDSRGRYITYFPTSGDIKYVHVRPHAQNSNDTLPLPVPDRHTKKTAFMRHSFWLNSNFVKKIVVEGKFYE